MASKVPDSPANADSAKADSAKARVFDMGPLGVLIVVEVPDEAPDGKTGPNPPHFVFIVDRSGSMGKYAHLFVNRAIPTALEQLGCPPDMPVTIITFDSQTERLNVSGRDPKLSDLATVVARSRGCTKMASVIPVVQQVYAELSPNAPVAIIAISDGGVEDIDATVGAAKKASSVAVSGRSAPTTVCLYRAMTDKKANPDTRALACIGAFNTASGKIPLCDIDTDLSEKGITEEMALQSFVERLVTDLKPTTIRGTALAAPANVLSRMPGDTETDKLMVPCGKTAYVLVKPKTDLTGLTCGGAPLALEYASLCDESAIEGFLVFTESQLRVWTVMGARDLQIDTVIEWFRQLEALIGAVQDVAVRPKLLSDRIRNLLVHVQKRKSTIIGRILALANRDRVSQLNSAQAAEFLRGNITSTGTAKRAQKTDNEFDFDGLCRESVRALAAASSAEEMNSEISFYSMASWFDTTKAAQEMLPEVDALSAGDILPILGGIGLAFLGSRGDHPDPWGTFEVKRVYLGPYLGENDINVASLQGGGGMIRFPGAGPEAEVNGVVPLRFLDPQAYDVYYRHARALADLQASISLRGALARIPYDCLARDSAVLWRLLCQVGHNGPAREVELVNMAGLRDQVARRLATAGDGFTELAIDLAREDPRAWLTGDRGVSGLLKPMTVLFASRECTALRADPTALARVLRTLYALAAYHAARRAFRNGGRTEALHALLGLDLDESRRRSEVGLPFEGGNPPDALAAAILERHAKLRRRKEEGALIEEDGEFSGDLPVDLPAASERAAAFGWMPHMPDFAAAARFANGTAPVELEALGGDLVTLRLSAAVEALNCDAESGRVDTSTRVAKGPLPGDAAATAAYAQAIARAAYRADYHERSNKKLTTEIERLYQLAVDELVAGTNHAEFIAKLGAAFPNRSSPSYSQLEAALLDFGRAVPLRAEKLWTILLGRDHSAAPVWAEGNIRAGDFAPFERAFSELDPAGELWRQVLDIKKLHGRHCYRSSKPNRHGHSNIKPAYSAYGHKTLEEFRLAVTEKDYTAYAQAHDTCCGFGK